ncbi:MAG: DUF6787 family protein [Saprospiraceae bacterium]|jgi:phosphate/sulfate permease
MLEKLQAKWKVSLLQVILILCVFTIGGSCTGYLAKKIMPILALDNKFLWTIFYILIMTAIWPIMVLIISIPFGQFAFFKNYLYRMYSRMQGKNKKI